MARSSPHPPLNSPAIKRRIFLRLPLKPSKIWQKSALLWIKHQFNSQIKIKIQFSSKGAHKKYSGVLSVVRVNVRTKAIFSI